MNIETIGLDPKMIANDSDKGANGVTVGCFQWRPVVWEDGIVNGVINLT